MIGCLCLLSNTLLYMIAIWSYGGYQFISSSSYCIFTHYACDVFDCPLFTHSSTCGSEEHQRKLSRGMRTCLHHSGRLAALAILTSLWWDCCVADFGKRQFR